MTEKKLAMTPVSLPLSENSLELLRERYLRRDNTGKLAESPEGMFERVARAVGEPARLFGEDAAFWEARFFERMRRLEFLPNSPTLMNAGLPAGQLAACFVLPIEDDLDSIFTALSRMARIHQTGGGTGFSFSSLRPREDRVHFYRRDQFRPFIVYWISSITPRRSSDKVGGGAARTWPSCGSIIRILRNSSAPK